MRLFKKRPRFNVVQTCTGKDGQPKYDMLATGLSLSEANRQAAYVNQQLAFFKAIAPSGPQDARAEVVEDARS